MMEKFVDEKLNEMLAGENCCQCERCIEDMKAIALNKLPSKYVSTHNGELFSKLDANVIQNSADILIAVSKAIRKVATYPAHDTPDGQYINKQA